MNLDTKDRRILYELELNARATYQQLGKKVGLSKENVIYRVKKLEENQIIKRYTTLINFGKLGYTGFAVYCRFQNVDSELKEEILEYISKISENYWIGLIGGKFDLVYGLMCKSVFDFNKVNYKILNKYGKHLVDSTIAIRTELHQYKRNYLIDSKREKFDAPYFGKDVEIEEIDELDKKILNIMSINARATVVDIAKKLNKAASTITFRIKALEKRGIIQGYWAYLRAQNFGMQSYRVHLYLDNINEETREKLFRYVHDNPNALLAIETVGSWNFEMTFEVNSQEEIQREISNIRNYFKSIVKNIEFIIMFEDDLVYDPYPLLKSIR